LSLNKSKIEWCDLTWNPVTGCNHGCEYCYAKKIANRFGSHDVTNLGNEMTIQLNTKPSNPYPYKFIPTFHKYRLEEPAQKTKGRKIFVCSMADLFGNWVPDEWTSEVLKSCEAAPQHKYLFLTKNPKRYSTAIPDSILEAADRLREVEIEKKDALELIPQYNCKECLIYLDPPYLKGTRKPYMYRHEFDKPEEHKALLELIIKHKGPVVLSGYDNEIYEDILVKGEAWDKVCIKGRARNGVVTDEYLWINRHGQISMFG
jgi:hypothetical protein